MAMMRTRTKSRGWQALALLVHPSTDFAQGAPGLKDHVAKRHPLHAGVARLAGAAQEDNSAEAIWGIRASLVRAAREDNNAEAWGTCASERWAIAEAERVLQDNDTVEKIKAVLRKAQKINPGKWTLSGKKDELKQKLREFVEEAKATLKGLKEDSRREQVTSWHPGRGGVASRASPQQDSGAEDWLAKSREEVEAFGEEEVLSWAEAVLNEGKVRDELIQRTVTTLQQQGVTGKSLRELTLDEQIAAGIPLGPAKLLTKKIQLLQEPQVELPRFSATDLLDFEDRFLNSRINNKDERPFLEREAVVRSLVEQIEDIQKGGTNKPKVLTLWSPRGTGKTSLVRHLALKVPNFSESRRCGRLLVVDAREIPKSALQEAPSRIASAIVVWHLSQLLCGYSIEVSGLVVSFRGMDFIAVLEALKRTSVRREIDMRDSFEVWLGSFCQKKQGVFEQWLLVTAAAFNATPDCACLVFLDQAELLVNHEVEGLSHPGGQKSAFTEIFGEFPQKMGMFSAGTVNILIDRPSEEYTLLKVQEVPALAPLSLQAARRAMAEWGGMQYKKKEFDNIHLFSAGVPRLLEAAFQTWGELASTAQVALNAMSQEFRSSYADAAPYFNQPEVALALVLCSAVRWPAEGHQLVPGTSVRWSDIFRAGAAFPNNKSVLVPRLWWCEDTNIKDAIRNDLKELNIDLEGLLPDSLQLLNSPTRGATERGEKWEELVANSLAARFRLHCIARNLIAEVTWVPFLKIYPTEDPHLRAVLEPFEVCWSDGVEHPRGQGNEATVMSDVGKAIKSNRNFATAHHDLLIPVRCKATGKLEFIAAQCHYGQKKDADGLKLQDKAKKDNFEDMQNVLLQICSESEGWQSFTNKTWARRQEEKKYSLMSCETIIAQLDVLKLL
ncbi:unnamed protein product [Effrenium voratum]|uniref:Uncharacterized protein n=1 Tax=Effrenium voratum TaxID=2562239 RepID=A0AA36NEB4_9DINO|nr:unnamed protein product [Effrenium voratum]